MSAATHEKSLAQRLLASLLAATAYIAVSIAPALAGDGTAPSTGPASTAPATVSTSEVTATPGLMVHIDPQTGAFLKEPAPGSVPLQLTPALRNSVDTSHEGLVEEQGVTPGSGVRVHLQGRFLNPLFATTDASGKLTIQHLHEPAESGAQR